ncbi:hypothetical protein ACN28C_00630 [Plantactinospora sp. WMMC1484]|uniref:hypothetical protein n=1 Tax=Plantactinospora sp. WMMC1484 TaxID=3404122 RepID=UPI003BF5559A
MNEAVRIAMAELGETAEPLAEKVAVDPKTAARWVNPGRIADRRHRGTSRELFHIVGGALRPGLSDQPSARRSAVGRVMPAEFHAALDVIQGTHQIPRRQGRVKAG